MSAGKVRVRVLKEVAVFPRYRPRVGRVYDAVYSPAKPWKQGKKNIWGGKQEFCVIDILDKKIILRSGEFEIV